MAGAFLSGRNDRGRSDDERPYLSIHHVTVYVRDQDQSLRFFVEKLGFRLVIDYCFDERNRFILLEPPDGTTMVALMTPAEGSEEYKLIGRPAQAVFVTDDIDAEYSVWRDAGVVFQQGPIRASWGGVNATFEDLDANSFALIGYDEITRQVAERRRAIAAQLEAERRTAQELAIAKEVQAKLFPQRLPEAATLDYAGICIQAREVGGDYYDFLDLGRGRLGLVVGDISGKGIAAALLMANLQANLRSQCAMASDHPERFLQYVNQLLFDNTIDSAYTTLFFCEYDDATRTLRYANCGHVPAVIIRSGGNVEQLHCTGTVLGLFRDWECAIEEQELLAGDTLVIYTDGVTEAFSSAGEEFGDQRLIDLMVRNRGTSAERLVTQAASEVLEFSSPKQSDDVTLIVGKCR